MLHTVVPFSNIFKKLLSYIPSLFLDVKDPIWKPMPSPHSASHPLSLALVELITLEVLIEDLANTAPRPWPWCLAWLGGA